MTPAYRLMHVMIGMLSSHLMQPEIIILSCQKVCEALTFLLDSIGFKLYRQILGIPMGTNCAPRVADLFCSVMRETSCCPFLRITSLMLLKQ